MGRSVTLSDLRTDIQARYDLPTFSTTTFVTTSQVNRMINTSLQAFYAMLMEAFGDDYFATTSTLTVNSASNALPSDCVKIKKMFWARNTNDMVTIRHASQEDLFRVHYAAQAWSGPKYVLRQNTIYWIPVPNTTYTVYLHYQKSPADLSGDSDYFEAGPGWDEWVVLDVCSKIAEREEKDTAEWLMRRSDAERRVLQQSPERDEGDGLQVRDVRRWRVARMGNYELRDWITRDDW